MCTLGPPWHCAPSCVALRDGCVAVRHSAVGLLCLWPVRNFVWLLSSFRELLKIYCKVVGTWMKLKWVKDYRAVVLPDKTGLESTGCYVYPVEKSSSLSVASCARAESSCLGWNLSLLYSLNFSRDQSSGALQCLVPPLPSALPLLKCLTVSVLLILQAHVRQSRAELLTLCLNCELRYKNDLDGSNPSSQWQARQLILTLFVGQNLYSCGACG